MLPVLMLLASIAIVAACSERGARAASSPPRGPSYSAEVTKGAWLYVDYACVQCHGVVGRGRELIPASGPSLVSPDFKKTFPKYPQFDAALSNLIRNGVIMEQGRVASMPSWNGILSDDELESIVAYIRAGLPNVNVPISSVRTGEEIYRAFACVKCHGEPGRGGIRNVAAVSPEHREIPTIDGANLRKKFGSREEVRKVILSGSLVDGGRPGVIYMPAWGGIGTADQIEMVTEYVWNTTQAGK